MGARTSNAPAFGPSLEPRIRRRPPDCRRPTFDQRVKKDFPVWTQIREMDRTRFTNDSTRNQRCREHNDEQSLLCKTSVSFEFNNYGVLPVSRLRQLLILQIYSFFSSGVVHKWRHAILDNFWPPSSRILLFSTTWFYFLFYSFHFTLTFPTIHSLNLDQLKLPRPSWSLFLGAVH